MSFVIHIGTNKTASTTLQRCLFSVHDGLVYMGEDGCGYEDYKKIVDSITSDDDINYREEDARQLFKRHFSDADSRICIYSNEDIMMSRVPSQCARRLSELMPGAKIMMVIRSQLTAIPSWYANHGAYLRNVPRSYWRRYVSFEDWMEYCTSFINEGPFGGFFYKKHAELWASYFGRENLHILLYEDFCHNKELFVEQLSDILQIDSKVAKVLLGEKRERKRNTVRMHKFQKIYNNYLWGMSLNRIPFGSTIRRSWNHYLEKGEPLEVVMPSKWQLEIASLFGKENSWLAEEFGLPLRKFGYPLD